jgi:hypothetical protein
MSIRIVGRRLALTTAAAVLAGTVAGLSFGTASYAVANGSQVPGSAVPTGSSSTSAFSSGQSIVVSIPANSDLVPGTKVNILECSDPDGTPANLPTNASDCDGNTIQGNTVFVNGDGSVRDSGYTVYALPDTTSLGEPSGGSPVCDLSDECVLYVGENQGDFTQPHYFSEAFYVNPVAGDTGTPAGNGAVQNITFTSTASPAVVGATYSPTTSGGPSGNPVVFSLDGSSTGCSLTGSLVHFTSNGTCVINANQAGNGTYATAAQVTQSLTTVSGTFITTSSLPAATRGQAYGPVTLHAASTTGSGPFKWKKLTKLPKGMKLSSSGVLSGTLKSKHVNAGNVTVEVQVQTHKTKTSPKMTATRSFTLRVN